MKQFDTIPDVLTFLSRRHKRINSFDGVFGFKFLRKPSGEKIPFEFMRGVRIKDFKHYEEDDTLVIEHISNGLEFKGNQRYISQAMLYLQDLAVINVYDHRADFISWNSIDFSYIENSYESQQVAIQDWIHGDHGILRAQWSSKRDGIDNLLDELSVGRTVFIRENSPRYIHIDENDEDMPKTGE